ncbi:similar to Saccharomyces cerevisiae YER005W YND1 Apyrase with wide substrate specificity [Maudiozyma saulgeensis]|uniref:Similar to Saccharomyces cerevisiae YER005W YND1 Apyrase with wide substrate specificity n=1 Tax=Maudiozyma saulgeensis TaxID=1789683 RepID=A0A1X7R2W0_9SACH|nr:similar to Saccharomyces cerevisiae YER005W YND1 Apyrase with wide substrate specificity [Kazachstania saulgeensis]
MITGGNEQECYGIVIDAGSSGSRLHVFKWTDPATIDVTKHDPQELHSVPKIEQSKEWTFKSNPGLSSFEHKTNKAFSDHINPLLKEAEKIIPNDKLSSTPVFIQATAGMRLLPKKNRDEILEDLCTKIKKSTRFKMDNCETQIQIIDGETEGIYGWLGLNYLLGNFNNYNGYDNSHFTMGFMDMGGASAQIAFVPSDKEEIIKYKHEIPTVYLRSLNGDVQEWDVFVSTWLGFGANQARKRYLAQLINALPENTNNYDDDDFTTRSISDPCMPNGSKTEFEFKDTKFKVVGLGNFEQCSKSIYPLLLKNIPCPEERCLFNGVHIPKINFLKDKFVGISEFWYTPNDVFNLGGEYSFSKFSAKVEEFCNTDWETIKHNNEDGKYNLMPEKFLQDACFKSNWIINILHEGFELPQEDHSRLDTSKGIYDYPMFQSLDKVVETDLSWTLGRILLYACGMVPAVESNLKVGIAPSARSAKDDNKVFIPGLIGDGSKVGNTSPGFLKFLLILILIGLIVYTIIGRKLSHFPFSYSSVSQIGAHIRYKLSELKSKYETFRTSSSISDLEAGELGRSRFREAKEPSFMLKSKSMFNLNTNKQSSVISYEDGEDTVGRPLSQGLQSSQSSANMRPAFSMADFSKFQNQ